jgi:uncharacterized ferritin-like protein (DUF455 family)
LNYNTKNIFERSLATSAIKVLETADPCKKVKLSLLISQNWSNGSLIMIDNVTPPAYPARPVYPRLVDPKKVARRRINTAVPGRVALLHALAHIELNAIDLAWDIIARFSSLALPTQFFTDWIKVATEEAKHFSLLSKRLCNFDKKYGDLEAHVGLWDSAWATRHDLAARLAIVPLVLEARGLDVTPNMIIKLRNAGDKESAEILEIIYEDEIQHVKIGKVWFDFICASRGVIPEKTWQNYVAEFFKGNLKPPFNKIARDTAGIPNSWYNSKLIS